MTLVRAALAHADALAAIHADSFAPPERWDAPSMAAQLALPGVFGFLHPDGAMLLARAAADEAEILTLAVTPSQRRRGLATALMHAAHDAAIAAGATRMFLEVAVGNVAAVALYSASGYRAVGRRRGYYADGSDALVLARPLNRAAATGG